MAYFKPHEGRLGVASLAVRHSQEPHEEAHIRMGGGVTGFVEMGQKDKYS